MLNIAICDDSQIFMLEIQSLLQKDERVGTVRLYSQPELLCADLTGKQGEFDAVLMDIDFRSQKNGFDYAQELYRIAPNLPLIYVTGYTDQYAQFAFLSDANLAGYMTKPIDEGVLSRYLDKLAERHMGSHIFTFATRKKEYHISAEQILYLESRDHMVSIHTSEGEYFVHEKLSSLAERLPSFFVQCHKSFLVNMNWIARLGTGSMVLRDNSLIPISKSRQAQTKSAFLCRVWETL